MNANILTADRTAKRHTAFSRLGIATTFLTANNFQYNTPKKKLIALTSPHNKRNMVKYVLHLIRSVFHR